MERRGFSAADPPSAAPPTSTSVRSERRTAQRSCERYYRSRSFGGRHLTFSGLQLFSPELSLFGFAQLISNVELLRESLECTQRDCLYKQNEYMKGSVWSGSEWSGALVCQSEVPMRWEPARVTRRARVPAGWLTRQMARVSSRRTAAIFYSSTLLLLYSTHVPEPRGTARHACVPICAQLPGVPAAQEGHARGPPARAVADRRRPLLVHSPGCDSTASRCRVPTICTRVHVPVYLVSSIYS